MSMAAHVEHHRQELLEQARRERLAKEAIAGRAPSQTAGADTSAAVSRARSIFARLRPALTDPVELPQSSPGEA
jgi:hypothetical protein